MTYRYGPRRRRRSGVRSAATASCGRSKARPAAPCSPASAALAPGSLVHRHRNPGNGVGGGGDGGGGFGGGQLDWPEIVVTGKRPPRKSGNLSVANRFARCAATQLGLSDLIDVGLVVSGQPIPGTKPFVTSGSSRGTSVAGMAADQVFGSARFPRRMPTLVGGPGTGRRLAISGTKSIARFAGRAVPIVGWALLAYDAASIAVCTARGE